MSRARFKVHFAGPLVSFQDAGRPGAMRFGAPASGPMDRLAHASAHAMLGNPQGGTAIEISLGGLVLECVSGAASIAVAGGSFAVTCGAHKSEGWGVHTLHEGDKLTIRAGSWGSWGYLAFAGTLLCDHWLGHSATHTLSGFGGGTLATGDMLEVEGASLRDSRAGDYPCPDSATALNNVHVVIGPQDHHFQDRATDALLSQPFALTDAFDRMGVRLKGPDLPLRDVLSIPSEPILRGSIQVSGDGIPTVLLADHQTTGGYPKIATVLSCDIDRLAQKRSGDTIRFQAVTAAQALSLSRAYRDTTQQDLAHLAAPRATLAQRLMQHNLISGVICE